MQAQAILGLVQNIGPLLKGIEGLSAAGGAVPGLAKLVEGGALFGELSKLVGGNDATAKFIETAITGVLNNPELIKGALSLISGDSASAFKSFASAHTPSKPSAAMPGVKSHIKSNEARLKAAQTKGNLGQMAVNGDVGAALAFFYELPKQGGYSPNRGSKASSMNGGSIMEKLGNMEKAMAQQVLAFGNSDPNSAVANLPKPATFEDLVAAFMIDQVSHQQDEVREKMAQLESLNNQIKSAKGTGAQPPAANRSVSGKAAEVQQPSTAQVESSGTKPTSSTDSGKQAYQLPKSGEEGHLMYVGAPNLYARYEKVDGEMKYVARQPSELSKDERSALKERRETRSAARDNNKKWYEKGLDYMGDAIQDGWDELLAGEGSGIVKAGVVVALLPIPGATVVGVGMMAVGGLMEWAEGDDAPAQSGGGSGPGADAAPGAPSNGRGPGGPGATPGKDDSTGSVEELKDSRALLMEQMKNSMNKLQQMQSALSNVLKAMHDTAMSSIRNIK